MRIVEFGFSSYLIRRGERNDNYLNLICEFYKFIEKFKEGLSKDTYARDELFVYILQIIHFSLKNKEKTRILTSWHMCDKIS